ncbi:FMN-dependent NADH-azoreductase [Marinobacterium lacunae]|uniref:FMN dependent NADH:quinone oxidoreductase n=1 Tax=Marinobacterium lacunae TaxID=1232683 RepID=A0A081FZN6_9GAMM|nr:NAD(P)H-dependent oxidoreductase [Marinobacterium lacunae]KEA63991.1 FMN-dependent NADH-azoreductase [Marinobacterium lacunae]MBR9885605.1 FMN-dependent NADH-azoreductase [Oceanospirillales bacterium]
MAKLLYVKSSIFGDQGQSSQLAQTLIEDWKTQNPGGEVITRDLSGDAVPHLDGERFGAFLAPAEERSAAQQAVVELSDTLIDEVRQADMLVVGVPMYNFGVPSQMKAWFDHMARAGVTFKYTETGPVGLLEDKPVLLLATRGGLYKDAGLDFQIPFVKQFFSFIGLNDSRVIFAEGLAMGDLREETLSNARQALGEQLQ